MGFDSVFARRCTYSAAQFASFRLPGAVQLYLLLLQNERWFRDHDDDPRDDDHNEVDEDHDDEDHDDDDFLGCSIYDFRQIGAEIQRMHNSYPIEI